MADITKALTLAVGFIKRHVTARKLRRHTAGTTKTSSRSLEAPSAIPLTSDIDVEAQDSKSLFGIRAVQSGIEIDGVWISPTISPVSSRDSSPMSSFRLSRNDSEASFFRSPNSMRPVKHTSDQNLSSTFFSPQNRISSAEQRLSRPPSFAPKVRFADELQAGHMKGLNRQSSLPRDYAVADLSKYAHESSPASLDREPQSVSARALIPQELTATRQSCRLAQLKRNR